MHTDDDAPAAPPLPLDDEQRRSHLVTHLGRLVQRGGEIVEHTGYRAVVQVPKRSQIAPNVLMAAIGVALFLWVGGAMFLLGAGVALLGWHRKLVAGAELVLLMVRVDEDGRVSERVLETA